MWTGKSQPEGPLFQWETRLVELPTPLERWTRGLGFSCRHALNINDRFFFFFFFFTCPMINSSSLFEHGSVRGKTIRQSQTSLVPKCSFCYTCNQENAYPHLIFLFTNKGAIDFKINFLIAVSSQRRKRRKPTSNIATFVSHGQGCGIDFVYIE